MKSKFSIIVVSLNAGEKLKHTLNSINEQEFKDFEVIIKDGGSTDGSLDYILKFDKLNIRTFNKPDKGIYDAMNQALLEANGEYTYFLNCGDAFNNSKVLYEVNSYIDADKTSAIIYGNIYDELTKNVVSSNPNLDSFGCYRNVPCHQACFYNTELIKEHPFDIKYKVRADYEQFLWCFFAKKVKTLYCDVIVADYEGGGFSETKEHLKLSKKEHTEITEKYIDKIKLIKYKLIMIITLSSLRTYLAHNKVTAKIYNGIKNMLYRNNK